jgi:hypothetical protein
MIGMVSRDIDKGEMAPVQIAHRRHERNAGARLPPISYAGSQVVDGFNLFHNNARSSAGRTHEPAQEKQCSGAG